MPKSSLLFIVAMLCVFASSNLKADISYIDELMLGVKERKLWQEQNWQKLLFYTPTWFGSKQGIFDSPQFYNAKNGKHSLEDELEATLRAFFLAVSDFENPNFHPQCAFPARFRWLEKVLEIDKTKLPQPPCEDLATWIGMNQYQRISLVFSSYYPNNPASMFGHTFLRLHRSLEDDSEASLLDASINYSAYPTTENPILYPLMGMTGFFPGRYQLLPYYVKVQQYNNSESRDLWEYELNVSKEQIDTMLLSLWEIGNNWAGYYYFDDNCSAILLTMIEAMRPELELKSQFRSWVIPADTVRAVTTSDDLIRQVRYRPSILNFFLDKYEDLSTTEKRLLPKLNRDYDAAVVQLKELDPLRQVRVLDASLDYIDFKDRIAGASLGDKLGAVRQKLLLERAQLKIKPKAYETSYEHERPDLGHPSNAVSVLAGVDSYDHRLIDFLWRPALHDLISNKTGYPDSLAISFFHLRLRGNLTKESVFVDEFSLFRVWSLPKAPWLIRGPAWNVDLGAKSHWSCEKNDQRCLKRFITAGGGLSQPLIGEKVVPYILFGAEAGLMGDKRDTPYIAAVMNYGLWLELSSRLRSTIKAKVERRFSSREQNIYEYEADLGLSLTSQDELRLHGRRLSHYGELSFGYLRYF
jgi:hypothetical protein